MPDIAALVDPSCARWEQAPTPSVGPDMRYDSSKDHGAIVRTFDVDRDRAFSLLEESLRRLKK